MTVQPFTRAERDAVVHRLRELETQIYPPSGTPGPSAGDRANLREQFYVVLGEYSDRLPRLSLSVCPYCAVPLRRVFDPFGVDGPWWHTDVQVTYEDPRSCEHFKVLLGALTLADGKPVEATEEVRPGPEVPFVVPALLSHPGMIAVVGRLELATGHIAFPIAYFSNTEIAPIELHQPWCRKDLWFKDDEGNACWTIANDLWDFDLAPYMAEGRLRWVLLEETEPRVRSSVNSDGCPFLDLPGERCPQQLVAGEREFLPLPTGEPLNPFE